MGDVYTIYDYVFIDEAQRLQNPGLTLKVIHDNIDMVRVVATGSSSFDLKNRLSDALTVGILILPFIHFHLQKRLQFLMFQQMSCYTRNRRPCF
ncbi:AAA family ATPase [Patescibacteria group bacterium]|nr:AAA family ATPase [Patescibacteria group bacterium]